MHCQQQVASSSSNATLLSDSDAAPLVCATLHLPHCICCACVYTCAGEFSAQDTRRLFSVVVDEAIQQLQPGQDQFVGIIDLRGFTMANVDLGFGAFVIEAFLAMYPGR